MRWPVTTNSMIGRNGGEIEELIRVIDYFDTFNGPNDYAFLSNFHEGAPIDLGGQLWPTVEHFFQAAKATKTTQRDAIQKASSPGKAKAMGQRCLLRSDWEAVKV